MQTMNGAGQSAAGGWMIRDVALATAAPALACENVLELLGLPDLASCVDAQHGSDGVGAFFHMRLHAQQAALWAPGYDTLSLSAVLGLDPVKHTEDLNREIVISMLLAPIPFEFPSVAELLSAVRIRCYTVVAARKTTLAFHTSTAERPEDCWTYNEDHGFILRPGVSLIRALVRATQPEVSGALYSFSCYRASEYLIVLGIAQELVHCNPALLLQLETLWAHRPIKSGEFHDVFLREQGSMEAPVPPNYFVPGDRTWFRNPHEASADASGFEGSWVMYLGGGLFNNFWKTDAPYTLTDKCLEIYHWRHGLYLDSEGEPRIDEGVVAVRVQATLQDPQELARVLRIMQRYREPRGVYTDAGGCIDTTREFARWVCPGTADLVLPAP